MAFEIALSAIGWARIETNSNCVEDYIVLSGKGTLTWKITLELSVKITLELTPIVAITSIVTITLRIFCSHMEENRRVIVTIEVISTLGVNSRVIVTDNSRVIFHVRVPLVVKKQGC